MNGTGGETKTSGRFDLIEIPVPEELVEEYDDGTPLYDAVRCPLCGWIDADVYCKDERFRYQYLCPSCRKCWPG